MRSRNVRSGVSERPGRASAGWAALLLGAVAACGSTVNASRRPAPPDLSRPDALPHVESATIGPIPSELGAVTSPDYAGATYGAAPGSGRGRETAVTSSGRTRAGGRGTATGGRRITPRQPQGALRIGLAWQRDTALFADTIGFKADPGDYRAAAEAVVEDINARGGVLGQRVALVPYEDETARSVQNPVAAAQRACTFFTEDERVDVAISAVSTINIPVLYECMAQHDTPVVIVDANPHSVALEFQPFASYLYHPATIAIERLAPRWVDRLAARRYFTGWDVDRGSAGSAPVKVGVLHQTGNEPYAAALSASFARHGVGRPLVMTYSKFEDAAQYMGSYVFQMRDRGVTHVFVDKPVTTMLFMVAADKQRYRPRYGLATSNGPVVGLEQQDAVPREQLRGALGVGYVPLADASDATGWFVTADSPARRCERIANAASVAADTTMARLYQHLMCDSLWLLERGFEVGGSFDTAALRRGVESAQVVRGASTVQIRLQPGRHDGAGSFRDLAYESDCDCFRYSGPDRPL